VVPGGQRASRMHAGHSLLYQLLLLVVSLVAMIHLDRQPQPAAAAVTAEGTSSQNSTS
jgi:hypothetical protein